MSAFGVYNSDVGDHQIFFDVQFTIFSIRSHWKLITTRGRRFITSKFITDHYNKKKNYKSTCWYKPSLIVDRAFQRWNFGFSFDLAEKETIWSIICQQQGNVLDPHWSFKLNLLIIHLLCVKSVFLPYSYLPEHHNLPAYFVNHVIPKHLAFFFLVFFFKTGCILFSISRVKRPQ